MVARTQINRSRVNGERPPDNDRAVGELFVNIPDRQLAVIDTGNDSVDLLAVRFWNTLTAFHVGDIVWRSGDLRRCIPANATIGTFVPAEWDPIATMGDITSAAVGATEGLKAYSDLATYVTNDLVSRDGSIYRALVDIAVPEPWDPTHWLNIVPPPLPEPIPTFSATASYVLNDLVVLDGKIYRAKGAIPPGAFNPTQWDVIAGAALAALPDGGPTNEPPQDGNYYVRQNHSWVRTALWEFAGSDVLLKISGVGVIRVTPGGLLEVKGDVEVFSLAV
jgi:hypothetical protein